MRWLPSETLFDVLSLLPDDCLSTTIPFVCRRLRDLAELALAAFHPMVAKIVHITWDPKLSSHQLFIQSVKYPFSIGRRTNLPTKFPAAPPSRNIVGIERIRVEGRMSREVLQFLSHCAVKIENCELDFENLEEFLNELAEQKIHLDEFFAVFGSRCSSVWLDGRFCSLSPDFLSAVRCPSLSILRPLWPFDAQSLQNWINCPRADGRAKLLTIIGNGKQSGQVNNAIEHFVQMLLEQCRQQSDKNTGGFVVELHNFCMDNLKQFEDGHLSFCMVNPQFWMLKSKTPAEDEAEKVGTHCAKKAGIYEKERRINIDTFIDIGTFRC
uniref:F-box domain-containing protein n=1 Tax=Globodera rostochiensis TaxID=31243 RepID=A0A914HVW5_GLORO